MDTATACYGNDVSEFPSSNFFASAGEGIWDNGAACGRQYLVRCISAVVPMTCIAGQTIQIKIVDRAVTSVSRPSRNGATMVLSTTAFGAVANASASSINIEFQQYVSLGLSLHSLAPQQLLLVTFVLTLFSFCYFHFWDGFSGFWFSLSNTKKISPTFFKNLYILIHLP